MRIFKSIRVVGLALALTLSVVPTLSANASPVLDQKEIRTLTGQVLALVQEGKESEVENLPLSKKYKEIFEKNPDLKTKYINSLDVTNAAHNRELRDTAKTFKKGDRTFTVFEDGSFSVTKNTINAPKVENGIVATGSSSTGEQWYSAFEGQSFVNDSQTDLWAVVKSGELHLRTNYNIYSTSATISDVNYAGTWTVWPLTLVSSTTSTQINNQRTVNSKGEFVLQNNCGSQGACTSLTHVGYTYITVQYAGDGTIKFTVKSDWNW
ncbi:hypothetical protein [Paenibacillus sp. 1P03SA]|uniref:hypothetical protein n=1 Tax=Paenibacillus sp. 1P03SA TaxID=3132294 RepID=UPI0039A0EAD9